MTAAGVAPANSRAVQVIRRAPAGTTTRFVLLVVSVVATSAFLFVNIYAFLPGRFALFTSTFQACAAQRDAAISQLAVPVVSAADLDRLQEVFQQSQKCAHPAVYDQARFVGYGLSLLFVVAGLSYLSHPWWLSRRRRLRRLSASESPGLVASLEQIRAEIGLPHAPQWRLAPYARTAGGQAFGTPGRRRIQIDAGLAILHSTNRPAFRVVVLHELAHVRNRDVDKTYLAIGIWRAFIAVAVVPFLAVLLHPGIFRAPWQWHWRDTVFASDPAGAAYRLASLLVLTVFVYLSRNAILRVRELHADAAAAVHDGPGGALAQTLHRLPQPRGPHWWNRWGTHPLPAHRLRAVADPLLLLRVGWWELTGAGLAAGMVCANAGYLLTFYLPANIILAHTALGLTAGTLMAAMLAAALWRAATATPGSRPAATLVVGWPIAVVIGFIAGSLVSLQKAGDLANSTVSVIPRAGIISIVLLAIGALLLAVWVASAGTAVAAASTYRWWAMPAVAVAAAVAFVPWFAVWFAISQLDSGMAIQWGYPPAAGSEIGWYATAAHWATASHLLLYRMVHNPFTLPGLTLLWLIPVLAGLRRRTAHPMPIRQAITTSLAGAAALAAAAVAMPLVAKTWLPATVRQLSDTPVEGTVPFQTIYDNTYINISALIVAAVAALTVIRVPRHRPACAAISVCLTAVLATILLVAVADPVGCYLNVHELAPAPTQCLPVPAITFVTATLRWITIQGAVLAVPATILAVVAQAITRRVLPQSQAQPEYRRGIGPIFTTILCGVLAVINLIAAVVSLPKAYEVWLDRF